MTLDIEQVNQAVNDFVRKYKEFQERIAPIERMRKKEGAAMFIDEYPEYWPGYNEAVQQDESISVHFNRGRFPDRAFRMRAPNQTLEEADYIRKNFKSTTLSVGEDFLNTIARGMNRQNWQIVYSDDYPEFREYVEFDIPNFGSVESFFENILPPIYLQDANGLLVLRPNMVDFVRDDKNNPILDEEGMATIDNSEIKPTPMYYASRSIVGQQMYQWYMIMTSEKSMVEYGGKNVREGFVLELYDDQNIWRIEQTGKKIDYSYNVSIFYPHALGYVPAQKLGGRATFNQYKGLFFNSPFNPAVDLLDEVLIDNMTLFLTKKKCVFPYTIVVGNPCNFERDGQFCRDGRLWVNATATIEAHEETCPQCNGAGAMPRITPSGQLVIKPSTALSEGDQGIKSKFLEYVSPDVTTLEFLRKEKEININEARKQIHLRTADQQATGGVDTATGVLDEMKSMQAFIRPIIYQLFDRFEFLLSTIGRMKYGIDFEGFKLTPPQDLDISTPGEYIELITRARAAGAPAIVIQQLMAHYLKSVEFTDETTEQAFRLIFETDDLITVDPDQIAIDSAAGVYQNWQRYLHNSSLQLIYRLSEADPTFFDQEFTTQQQQLIAAAKAATAQQQEVTPETILRIAAGA